MKEVFYFFLYARFRYYIKTGVLYSIMSRIQVFY